ELERHAEALGKLARQIRRDAARLAVRPLLREHAVAVVDRGAQLAGRRELLQRLGRHLCGGRLRGKRKRRSKYQADHRRPPRLFASAPSAPYASALRAPRACKKAGARSAGLAADIGIY